MSVPVMSDGIRSGVNWMRLNFSSSTLRQRRDQQRLRQAGHADDQAVAADEQRLQHELDDVGLADDALLQLRDDLLAPVVHPVGQARRRRQNRNQQLRSAPRDPLRCWMWRRASAHAIRSPEAAAPLSNASVRRRCS